MAVLKKSLTVLVVVFIVLAAVGGGGGVLYKKLRYVKEDFTPLAPFCATQNYTALIDAVKKVPAGPAGFTFVVLGDTRTNFATAKKVLGRAAEEKPVFILHTGDLDRRGNVDEFVSFYMPLVEAVAPIPMIPVPGNHEEGPNHDLATYKNVFGDVRFSFDYGDCRFAGFDNSDRDSVGNDDMAFLSNELAKPGVTHKFVITHIPPRYMEQDLKSKDERGFRRHGSEFRKLMADMKVDHVFVGHVHGYATDTLDGVRYTITGGAGAPLTSAMGDEARVNNFIVMHVGPDGVKEKVFRLKGDQWVANDVQ